ncbi:hypothetical protein AeMF1_014946, partial [Aphanomyces euteiches]
VCLGCTTHSQTLGLACEDAYRHRTARARVARSHRYLALTCMKCFPGLGCVGTTRVRVQRARDTVGNFNWLQHSLAGSCTVAAGVAMKPYGVIEGVESILFNNHVAHQL